MVASRQVEVPYYRGVGWSTTWTGIWGTGRTAIPFLRNYIVPAAKRVGADLLDFAVPEIAEVASGRKNIKTAAKSVGRQTLRKQLGGGSRRRTAGNSKSSASRIIPTKTAKQISRSRRDIFTNISH